MTAPAYVERDTCTLPPLIDGDLVLPPGAEFTCAHRTWVVAWLQLWGGAAQPAWTCKTADSAPIDDGSLRVTPQEAGVDE